MPSAQKLYIFDFDGTLCATHEAISKVLILTFQERSLPKPDEEELNILIGRGIKLLETIKECAPFVSEEEAEEMVLHYREIYNSGKGLSHTRLYPHVRETLSELKEAGHNIVLISNKGEAAVINALNHFELSSYFSHVFGEQKDIPAKPAPDLFEKKIRPFFEDIQTNNILVIGDTAADIEFANNIGARSVWASYGYGNESACLKHRPAERIKSMHELSGIK